MNVFAEDPDYTANFVEGTIEMKSVSSLTFGPQGILFIGDPMAAKVFALDTKDTDASAKTQPISVSHIDQKLASMLGIEVKDLTIHDMAVNPISGGVYLSVSRGSMPLLVKVVGEDTFEQVNLQGVKYGEVVLNNAVEDELDRRGRSMRAMAITDLAYADEKLYVAGLSNEEFSSTFRSVNFPFTGTQSHTSLEIYHAAHGRYETQSPIKAFLPIDLGGEPHILASYTCTPLVTFPVAKLNSGEKVKGKTVAELGNRNTPLDIITFEKDGKTSVLIANSNRTLMKIDPQDILDQKESLTQRVERHGTAGTEFLGLAETGIQQMDKYSDEYVMMIQRRNDGSLNLRAVGTNRM